MSVNKTITNESTERERNEVFIESQVVREKTFDKTMDRFEVEYGNNSEEIKNLKENLESTNTQLSEKMDKSTTDLSISQINPNKGKINQNYLSNELLEQITGTTPVNAVPRRKSLLLEHNSWLNVRKLNLFNKNTASLNTIMNSNGYTSSDSTYMCSDFIEVDEGQQYFNSANLSGAYFDKNKEFVTGLSAGFSNPFNVPSGQGIKYLRITYRQDLINVLCEGTSIGNMYATHGDIEVSWNSEDLCDLLTDTIKKTEINNTSWANIVDSPNIFDKTKVTKGVYVVPSNGWTSNDANWNCSEFIKVEQDEIYTKNNASGYAFYTSTNASTYISGGVGDSFTTPSNANYVRVSVGANHSEFMLVKGNSLPSEYWDFDIRKFVLKNEFKDSFIDAIGGKKLATEGLNVLIFGDSITETATVSDDGSEYTEDTNSNWVTYSKKYLKLGKVWNYAKAGASYKDRDDVLPRQKLSHQITTAISNGRPADIIIISIGTNDWEGNLGDFDTAMSKKTLDDLDRKKIYEAIRWSFWRLKEHYPHAICFVATPIQRADANPFVNTIKAIIEMAERYNFIVIPAHSKCGIVKEFEVIGAQGRYLYDGLHPDTEGKKLMSKLYNSVILNHLENYYI